VSFEEVNMITLLLLASADVASANPSSPDIVITASRVPERREESAASVDVIDDRTIARLGEPFAYQLLRLTPSASVSLSGPAGTLAQVRIRGAEATHTLLFIDGIKANDLAFGDEPRFEVLNADLASRIEVVRGPQSALWGSQAIGGVIAVDGSVAEASGYRAQGEVGSNGFRRASAGGELVDGEARLSAAAGWQHSDGIDIFGGGDRDGYRNLSGRALASWMVSPDVIIGANGFALNGHTELDGNDPFTFAKSHELATRIGLAAGRLWGKFGSAEDGLGGSLSASLFRARNRNLFQGDEASRATGIRRTVSGQAQYGFATGPVHHQLIAAADYESESFKARDTVFGGLSNQDNVRRHGALTAEWKADMGLIAADLAIRHDFFSNFKDATNLRASLLAGVGNGISLAGSYSEGIAPPTLTELYGFFPGSFIGNPGLKPEKSRGFEASARYDRSSLHLALTAFRQRLHDEIATIFPTQFTSTVINRDGTSRRAGIEAEVGWEPGEALRVRASYAYLKATEPSGGDQLRELRRPRHSGAIALDGVVHRLVYGASLAYVGARPDTNFDVFPSQNVRLGAYWLADARLAYRLRSGIELFARGSNLLDQEYQDVFGYRTEGRGLYLGVRLADRRSSP
jgi:vitamin B12 transporter